MVVVDGGNLLFYRRLLRKEETEQMMFKARVIVDAYNAIGVDAVALGPYDFAAGLDALRDLQRSSTFPFLCANLLNRESGAPLFQPYTIVQRAGIRIGLLGVLDSLAEVDGLAAHADTLRVEPVYSTVKRYAQELRDKGCELVIVLSAADAKRFRLVAKNVEGVQLYVAGDPQDKLRIPWKIGSALVASSTQLGKYLGEVQIELDGPGDRNPQLKHHFVAMKPDDPDDPAVKRIVDRYYKHLAVIQARDPGRYSKDDEVQVNLKYGRPVYVSSAECAGCHPEERRKWEATAHAKAYESLSPQDRKRSECLECHVTGFGRWSGFSLTGKGPDLTEVQCEACHGAGSLHPTQGLAGVEKAGAKVCRDCHTRSRSPEFRYQEWLARISCSREPGASGLTGADKPSR